MKMRTKSRLTCLLATLYLCCLGTWAQKPYPKDILPDETSQEVKFKGSAPTISDFATAFFTSDEDDAWPEVWGNAYNAWQRHLKGKPQTKGSKLVVDTSNGFLRWDLNYLEAFDDMEEEDGDLRADLQMCFWNCADGKHKLFAVALNSQYKRVYQNGQYDGIQFFIYDNDLHRMTRVNEEEIGAYIERKYEDDEMPALGYSLPRQGKNIIVHIHHPKRRATKQLVWDGMRFQQN